ncbi:enolase C-terminal domain-like protein [Amycolatopsis sp. NBC_00355]|uniref:enolase C-terminal domain-like protein n=1 Tax=Amycolatopsis sp. NBC_00355 TaxID=2975957 RepID=UPI002E252B72
MSGLAASTSVPIAVGESLYSVAQFRDHLHRGAASIVQPDVARVGGITPWLKVAHLAEAFNVEACPHLLMEPHVSLAAAVPNGRYVEHIPQLRAITRTEMTSKTATRCPRETPGLGIDRDRDAMDDRRVSRTGKHARPPGHPKGRPGGKGAESDFVDLVGDHPGRYQQRAGAFRDRRAEAVRHEVADHIPERAAVRAVRDHPVAVALTGETADRDTLAEKDAVPLPEAPGWREITAGRGRGTDRQTEQGKNSDGENRQFPSHDHSSARRTPTEPSLELRKNYGQFIGQVNSAQRKVTTLLHPG